MRRSAAVLALMLATVVGLTLLHVELHDHLAPEITRAVLDGYRNRFAAVRSVRPITSR